MSDPAEIVLDRDGDGEPSDAALELLARLLVDDALDEHERIAEAVIKESA